jgi:hypothetical protein
MLNKKSNNTKLIMETWRRFMNEGTDITKQMTDMGHEAWRAGFTKNNGETPRFKPVPGNQSLEELQSQGFEGLEVIDGVVNQNINQPANKIVPALNHKLNGAPAVGYNKAMNKIQISSTKDIEKLADEFHKVWMECNSWQKDNSPEMFVPYSQLSSELKIKDLEQVELAIKIMYGENSEEHKLWDQAMNEQLNYNK